ncbi:MAG TPA: FtsX-like permease family protein [Tepidisphaeraceae bacterium]|jgi:hypothetical protein|nr:FtsX-like permease family protein [Tepidisphaeraceae bacterium]
MNRNFTFVRARMLLRVCCIVLFLGQTSKAEVSVGQFDADLRAIASSPSRVIGSEGYENTVEYVEAELAKLGDAVEVRRQTFPVMVPFTTSATMEIATEGGGPRVEQIYPFWPATVRVNATPAEGISGRIVYLKEAAPDQIKPASVKGQIAAIDAKAGVRWQQVAYFGASAILILGDEQTTHVDLRSHDVPVPVNMPRFYVPAGPLADSIRAGAFTDTDVATLKAAVSWKQVNAVNLYAFIKPSAPAPEGWERSTPPAAITFAVPLEASGLVPDLANGAGQAVQTAAGLAIARELAQQPVRRPVMMAFTGADSIAQLGTRNMFMALADPPAKWRVKLTELETSEREVEQQIARVEELQASLTSIDTTADRLLIDRIKKLIETDAALQQEALFRYRLMRPSEMSEELRTHVRGLEDNQVLLGAIRAAFDQRPEELTKPANKDLATYYLQRAMERLAGATGKLGLKQNYAERRAQLQRRIDLYEWLAGRLNRDPNPSGKANNSRLIEALIALDLSDGGVRVGPMFFGNALRSSNISQIQEFGDWFQRQQRAAESGEGGDWVTRTAGVIDLEPLNNSRSPSSWLAGPLPIGTEVAQAWGVPGFSLITLDDMRPRRDTPADTMEMLTAERLNSTIVPQLQAVSTMIRPALNDARFAGQIELKWDTNEIAGQVVSLASGRPVPDLPREGFHATYYYANNGNGKIPALKFYTPSIGLRRMELIPTDAEGRYRFEGLPRNGDYNGLAVHVYTITPGTGAITASSDLGKSGSEIKWFADIRQTNQQMRSIVFQCAEFSLFGLYDPRFLQSLGELLPLDARRNAEPQRFSFLIRDQMLAGFTEPSLRALLLFRYGRVGNRLMLLNIDLSAQTQGVGEGAVGYTVQQLNDLGALSMATVKDFATLDAKRLADYREAGVSSELVDDLHTGAAKQIEAAQAAYAADDGAALIANANGAWADEARVYQAAQDMASDVVRAAIFLLLLCVPFSFCMERLVIGSPNIYKQLGGTAIFFGIMTAALWSFHPAFKISSSPLVIILAFAIILMSLLVMWVVYGKFDTELKRIRSGRGTGEGASIARASVLMSAVLLGIANMRKRKFRTALTSITIVLITFAVLCFTSSSRFVGTTALPTGVDSSHPGLMLRQRGFRPMPNIVLDNLRAVLGNQTPMAQRWWNVNASDPNEQIHVVAAGADGKPPRIFAAQALLGLTADESRVSQIDSVLGTEAFARLEKEKDICFLSHAIAKQLEVDEGDIVKIGGLDLRVAAIFNAEAFDSKVATLSGESLAPLKYSSGALDAGGRKLSDAGLEDLDFSADVSASEVTGGAYEHLSATRFVIVHADVSAALPMASLRSVAIRVPDFKAVVPVADDLTRRFAITTFAGYEDGVKLVAAGNLASVSGAGQVAVPLAIAGLIVFNTMMGSIAERRREIHVYTSLGLAPLHVGALFVAEAMTYGLIGTVFGYVIGQGVGTLLMHLGWLGGVTLNYSGSSAMMTMGLILLIVLLSALVPARLASKIAAPSIERSWRVPLPKDDEIRAVLPFTINKTAADGALAYLADFFAAHQEGSIGKFSAGKVEAFTFEDEHGRSSRGLKTVIWLTPFDLGVRQHLMLLIHPGEYPEIYEVQVLLQRLSGDDGSWYRMNRTFLTELRKQFLAWRSLSPQRMLDFVEESKVLFAQTPERVVTTAGGEAVRLG